MGHQLPESIGIAQRTELAFHFVTQRYGQYNYNHFYDHGGPTIPNFLEVKLPASSVLLSETE